MVRDADASFLGCRAAGVEGQVSVDPEPPTPWFCSAPCPSGAGGEETHRRPVPLVQDRGPAAERYRRKCYEVMIAELRPS